MRKPLREQSECMVDDDTNSQLSDSLKKLNDIAQNITNFNFWLDVLPSKTRDKNYGEITVSFSVSVKQKKKPRK